MRAALLLLLPRLLAGQIPDTASFQRIWQFPVDDTVRLRSSSLDSSLTVELHRELDVHGTSMGWYLSVVASSGSEEHYNLLFHSLAWHGPYPTDLFAWIHRDQFFPDQRVLPVFGYPYELRLTCQKCAVAGDSTLVHFVAGTVLVEWRRLARANPPPSH